MDIFNAKPTPDSLAKESDNVLSVFRQTISKLNNIGKKAEEQRKIKLEEMQRAKLESEQLEVLAKKNYKIASKIDRLLND